MKGWRTVLFGVFIGLTAILASPEMQAFIAAHIPGLGAVVGTIIVILRALTTSSIFTGQEK